MDTVGLNIGGEDLNTEESLKDMALRFEYMDDSADSADRKRARGESSSPPAVASMFY
jgi:hypothetical protein